MQLVLYAVVPAALVILAFLSRKIKLKKTKNSSVVEMLFHRIALYVYGRLPQKFLSERLAPMERSLRLLSPWKRGETAGRDYFVKKLADLLMLLTAGSILGLALYVAARQNHIVSEKGQIVREPYLEEDKQEMLTALTDAGEWVGNYEVQISSRRYTKEESDALFAQASEQLPTLILNENPSLEEVTTDLNLCDEVPGYPFTIRWKCSNYSRIHSNGRVETNELPKEGEVVTLTAQYSYYENLYEQVLYAHVKEPIQGPEVKREHAMQKILAAADTRTLTKETMELPDTFEGKPIVWKETVKDNSTLIYVLILLAAVGTFFAKDKEVKKQMEERNQQLLTDYPAFVSQLVLYLGAGMTLRNIFYTLSKKQRKSGPKKETRYLQEELKRTLHLMEGGMAEAQAYEQFGLRCGVRQYTKLITLLIQNLKKGSNDLLRLLNEESQAAFAERLDLARKRGEEAGTKLLAPMMLLLGIVMIIIMIPAYTSF